MNYEKMWNTLKAESGYRNTNVMNLLFAKEETVKEIMDRIEKRSKVVNQGD